MYRPRTTLKRILTIALLLGTSVRITAFEASTALPSPSAAPSVELPDVPVEEVAPAVEVRLTAAETTSSWDSRLPDVEPFDLPVLYLHHEQQATAEGMRTLALSISGLAGGAPVQVEMVSWHDNPVTRTPHREAAHFQLPDRPCTEQDPCAVEWALDAATTLSDLYRLTLRDDQGSLLWQNPNPERPDFVALDTWEVGLSDYTVRVTYAALFPFARGEKQLYHRLTPDAVHEFIAGQFVPIIVETWQTQFDAWGYGPIHPEWDADKVVEVFLTCPPFALYGGTGTYTASTYSDGSPYPERRIWLLSSHNTLQNYDSLENGYRVIFSHEFHHIAQWNVLLWAGCPARKWTNVFIEAQAKVASSVQYPELEMHRDHLITARSEYSSAAQRYLELRLETSYADLEAETSDIYDAALYWRFLYEQFGDMGVIRAALEEMACRPVDDIPVTLDEIVDAALARLDGPYATLEQSIVAFGQANYALRLEEGRCATTEPGACGARYEDPDGMYAAPALEVELHYRGSRWTYDGSIPASYGADLIEVTLDPDLYGQPVTIAFRSAGAQFSVQAWRLHGESVDGRTAVRALTPHPESMSGDCGAECRYVLPDLDPAQVDRLALIVVRLDPHEAADPTGAYRLAVGSTP